MNSIPVATKNIIIINVLVMIMTSLSGDTMYERFALFYPTSPFFRTSILALRKRINP